MKKIKNISTLCFAGLLLSACGGSSSSSSPTNVDGAVDGGTESSQVLTVSLGADKTVKPNERVVLAPSIKNNSGAIKSYTWKEGSTILGTTDGLIYRSAISGKHIINLSIIDNANKSASDSITITVTSAPSVNISLDSSSSDTIKEGESVTLSSSIENTSAVGLTYQWFVNGEAVSGQTGSTFTFDTTNSSYPAGSYTISVEIRDANGVLIATNSQVITVLSNSNVNSQNNTSTTTDSLTEGLKAWYEFEDNANDSSGNNNHGEVFGNISYVNSAVGKGAKFDGNTSVVLLQSESLKSFNDKFTLSFWTKYNYDKEGARNVVVHVSNGLDIPLNGETGLYNYSNKNGLDFRVGAWGDDNTSSIKLPYDAVQTLDSQEEHLITFTVDGSTLSIYKDKLLEKTKERNNTYSISRPSSNWYIGSMGNVYYLDGVIDDLRLYNRVLTSAEIQKLYDLKN